MFLLYHNSPLFSITRRTCPNVFLFGVQIPVDACTFLGLKRRSFLFVIDNIKTLLNSRVFLLLLVSTTGSKVRSAPHTLCALRPSVTLHAPLSNASISAPLMSESCPSTTRNLKDFSGCFLFSATIVLAQSVAGNKRQDNTQHLRVVRDPFGDTGRSVCLANGLYCCTFFFSRDFFGVRFKF